MQDEQRNNLIKALVESHTYHAEKTVPMATTDAIDVIKSQLTENTGRHLLDSGGAYGRHWEKNQDNPPWENAAYTVNDGWVTHNLYHYMEQHFDRDETAVALEIALYAFALSDERKSDAWLSCMEDFSSSLLNGETTYESLEDLNLPESIIETVIGFQQEVRAEGTGDSHPFTFNTYDGENHTLSQVIQATAFGGPYAKYVMVQVHGGADVRGGYTSPRVYKETWGCAMPGEFEFACERCEWIGYESCLHGSDELIYQSSIDPFELEELGVLEKGDDEHPALDAAYSAEERGYMDGAVFHKCDNGHLGYVNVH